MNRTIARWLISLTPVLAAMGPASRAQTNAVGLADALATTLRLHPQARIAELQVARREGIRREATGAFDPLYSSGLRQSFAPQPLPGVAGIKSAALNVTGLDAAATRVFRNGISAGPVVELDRARDRLTNTGGLNRSRLALQMTIPLLRNRGPAVVAARENSAGVEVDASRLDLAQTRAELLAGTAIAYWNTAGAARLLAVARGSEQRGELLLANVDELIRADRIPRNDIHQVRANLAERRATRIDAEQQVVAARRQLALAMGLAPDAMADALELAEDLPGSLPAPTEAPEALRRLIARALERRGDYQAALRHAEAQRVLLAPARNALRPAVDLTLATGYSGLREGVYPSNYLTALVQGVRGADAIAGLRYEFAPRNNAAAGRLAQAEASARQAEWRAADLARAIAAEIAVTSAALRNAGLRLAQARESVGAFQEALNGEREKYRLGFGSLVDILTIEDRLTESLALEARARTDAAVSLARLRLASGTSNENTLTFLSLAGLDTP